MEELANYVGNDALYPALGGDPVSRAIHYEDAVSRDAARQKALLNAPLENVDYTKSFSHDIPSIAQGRNDLINYRADLVKKGKNFMDRATPEYAQSQQMLQDLKAKAAMSAIQRADFERVQQDIITHPEKFDQEATLKAMNDWKYLPIDERAKKPLSSLLVPNEADVAKIANEYLGKISPEASNEIVGQRQGDFIPITTQKSLSPTQMQGFQSYMVNEPSVVKKYTKLYNELPEEQKKQTSPIQMIQEATSPYQIRDTKVENKAYNPWKEQEDLKQSNRLALEKYKKEQKESEDNAAISYVPEYLHKLKTPEAYSSREKLEIKVDGAKTSLNEAGGKEVDLHNGSSYDNIPVTEVPSELNMPKKSTNGDIMTDGGKPIDLRKIANLDNGQHILIYSDGSQELLKNNDAYNIWAEKTIRTLPKLTSKKADQLLHEYKGYDKQSAAQPAKKIIKRSDIATKAAAAGYSPDEYEKLLKEKGIEIQ